MTQTGGRDPGARDAGKIDVAEIEAAWAAVFGGPPPIRTDPGALLAALVDYMAPAPAYTPAPLRPSDEDSPPQPF